MDSRLTDYRMNGSQQQQQQQQQQQHSPSGGSSSSPAKESYKLSDRYERLSIQPCHSAHMTKNYFLTLIVLLFKDRWHFAIYEFCGDALLSWSAPSSSRDDVFKIPKWRQVGWERQVRSKVVFARFGQVVMAMRGNILRGPGSGALSRVSICYW